MAEQELKKVQIDLAHHFNYQDSKRQSVEAQFITMIAFSMKELDKVAPVEEITMRAMAKLAESIDIKAEDVEEAREKAKDDANKSDSGQLLSVIAMYCNEGDLQKLYAHMKVLLTCGIASIDDDTPLNGNWINKLSPSDFKNLCGEYIGNFIT